MPGPLENAIPTAYRGTTFRSPLEARWAVFFDALGIAWTYEAEGSALDGERVVPDFWLPDYGCFWEVRASQQIDEDRFGMWAAIANTPVVISTRLPHFCVDLTPARFIVLGFPYAEPVPWRGPDPAMTNLALRQRVAEATGRTRVFSESRLPAECPHCERPVLLGFEAPRTRASCPRCQWAGNPTGLLARLGLAGDVAEAYRF